MKKILVFSQHFWPEVFRINDICKGLVQQGYHVDVICGLPNYPTGKITKGWGFFKRTKEQWEGVRIRRIWEIPRGRKNNLLRIFLNFVSWPFFCLFYLPFIGKGYDKVLMYQLTPVIMAFPAILYAKAAKTPLFIKILDYWPFSVFAVMNIKSKFLKKLITKISQWHYKKADGLIASFEGIQKMLISDVGIPPEKTIYIPQACGKYHEQNIYDEEIHKKYNENFCITFTGCINPAQCFDIVVAAAKNCYDVGYTDIHWIIVGDGLSKKDVEKDVLQAGLTEVFHFEGFLPVEDMPKYYGVTDAFIACLTKSILGDFGIPAKIIPYFAAGKPVIGALDGDAAELIKSTQTGYCGPANDVEALYENICKMYLATKKEREEMGARAKAYYLEHFEFNTQQKRLIDFMYNQLPGEVE